MFTKKKYLQRGEKALFTLMWWVMTDEKKKHAWQYDMGAWGWGYSVIQID